jgi:hypothetical protein
MGVGRDVVVSGGINPTHELLQVLERLDPFRSTGRELEIRLRERIREQVAFFPSEQTAGQLLFRGAQEQQALSILLELEQMPVRQALGGLEEILKTRENQEDYWPEGRLNAGVACELMGDLEPAQRYLEETVDILSGKGLSRGDTQTAA